MCKDWSASCIGTYLNWFDFMFIQERQHDWLLQPIGFGPRSGVEQVWKQATHEANKLYLDKEKAFKEIFRVLKPGGHFSISDVVLVGDLPESVVKDAEMYAGCVAVVLFFLDGRGPSGIYNVGTGVSRSFHDVARAVIAPIRSRRPAKSAISSSVSTVIMVQSMSAISSFLRRPTTGETIRSTAAPPNAARAALILQDDANFGASAVTLDTATSKQWLHLN